MNGLAPRGNPILGLSRFKENSTQLPYTTLIYGNGPGNHQPRRDPSIGPNSTESPYYVQYAAIHQEEAFHDGSDVAIFAAGPYAHLFQGTQEQSYIAHVFAYAMCIGDYTNQPHCLAGSTELDTSLAEQLGDAASTRRLPTLAKANPSLGRPGSTTSLQSDPNKPSAGSSMKLEQAGGIMLLISLLISMLMLPGRTTRPALAQF